MANDDLFVGLPPPSASAPAPPDRNPSTFISGKDSKASKSASPPIPKSALKREKSTELASNEAPQKRIRFKTTTEASETQVIEAMNKISSHIKNPLKFSKASKLAIQLIQAGSVKSATSDHFFHILEAAMSSPSSCTDPSMRADYHALFSAAQTVTGFFSEHQKDQLVAWSVRAILANDFYTDDSFVFSKAAVKIKEAISSLPFATDEDDIEEATLLEDTTKENNVDGESTDPFGLDAFLLSDSIKNERSKGLESLKPLKPMTAKEEEQFRRKLFLKLQREALIRCLEIAAQRYKIPWAQTVIDILAKHAFENMQRFTARQREAVEKLWASILSQQIRRKQGKAVSGKLDVTAFEALQEKYSHVKISIRRAVGGSGDHRAEQWLG